MSKINGKFAFIGSGNMGGAIIRGFINRASVPPTSVFICDKLGTNYPAFRQLGANTVSTIEEAVADADYIFLCVKPKDIRDAVITCCGSQGYKPSAVFVSIAAAVPISLICEAAGKEVPVIRTMPAMPMMIGEGAIAVCKNELVDNKIFATVCRLFSSIATVSVMEESLLNPVIAINGSSPAYVYLFIKAMLDGAEAQGISKEHALPLVIQTVIGSAKMVAQSDCSIEEQIQRVCSPGGTTLEAMKVLEKEDLVGAVVRAMAACTDRADAITKELSE